MDVLEQLNALVRNPRALTDGHAGSLASTVSLARQQLTTARATERELNTAYQNALDRLEAAERRLNQGSAPSAAATLSRAQAEQDVARRRAELDAAQARHQALRTALEAVRELTRAPVASATTASESFPSSRTPAALAPAPPVVPLRPPLEQPTAPPSQAASPQAAPHWPALEPSPRPAPSPEVQLPLSAHLHSPPAWEEPSLRRTPEPIGAFGLSDTELLLPPRAEDLAFEVDSRLAALEGSLASAEAMSAAELALAIDSTAATAGVPNFEEEFRRLELEKLRREKPGRLDALEEVWRKMNPGHHENP